MGKILLKVSILVFFLVLSFFSVYFANAAEPVKILLVPGHDSEVWGAQYGNMKEANMNLALATQIYNLLKQDDRFEVWITRDSLGYTTEFVNYFSLSQSDIITFADDSKKNFQIKIDNGDFIKKTQVKHNKASEDIAFRLYGINKWANENMIDAVIHVHFNDYPRKNKWTMGQYKGFTVYMPEEQMANSKESVNLARSIFTQLKTKYATSTYEKELGGFVPDQSLIALGSHDSLSKNVRSVLIEYGYIYRFGNSVMRHRSYTNMANLTVAGVKNYFFGE